MLDKLILDTGMLSFARSLQISEALMWGVSRKDDTETLIPLAVSEKGVRGQSSHYMKNEKEKLQSAGNSNPQVVEAAYVPVGCDAIRVTLSLRVMPGSVAPVSCDDPKVVQSYKELSKLYAEEGGYRVLAERYIWNLLNGRFAWRNAFQTDQAEVWLAWGKAVDRQLTVNVLDAVGRHTPKPLAEIARIEGIASELDSDAVAERLDDLAQRFAEALSGEDDPLTIEVAWQGAMLPGQEVFPSQEYLRDEVKDKLPSRVYAKVPNGGIKQASIHSQKIGAALRHIDDWHGSTEHGAVAVNPYSGVQSTGEVLRLGNGAAKDFYALRSKPGKLVDDNGTLTGDLHFVMANLVRGGVLGRADEEKKKKGADE